MADNYLITGYWGEPHVTAENDRGIHAGIFGAGRYVLPVGNKFRAEYIGNNTIRMYDGKLMDNGAAAGIPAGEYVDIVISNAAQGMNRNDLIVFQYSQDSSTLIEKGEFIVVQGIETNGTAADPTLTQADLLSGKATLDQMALWRVPVSGVAIAAPVQVFALAKTLPDKSNTDHSHALTSSKITGILPVNKGGTGANDAAKALENLGAAESGHSHALTGDKITGVLPVAKGGTGATNAADACKNIGALPLTGGNLTGDLALGLGNPDTTGYYFVINRLVGKTKRKCRMYVNGETGATCIQSLKDDATMNRMYLEDGKTAFYKPVDMASGGTGATTADAARVNLKAAPADYQAAEIATGGTWIDGKPIYRQVVSGSAEANKSATIGTIANIDTVVNVSGMFKWTSAGVWCPLVYSAAGTTYNTASVSSTGEVTVLSTQDATGHVIVEYTKTN